MTRGGGLSRGKGRGEETEMVMRQSRRDRGKRHTRKGWKETYGNRERGTVREEDTERTDGGRDKDEETMVKRQSR